MKKAIYYLNQFFGQIGGEEKADYKPDIQEGVLGPGMLLKNWLDPDIEVTHTVVCGDNFFGSKKDEALAIILGLLEDKTFDVFIAGPAFMAGRYGFACGEICKAVKEKFHVPVITSMNVENPAVEMFRKDIYIFSGGKNATAMRKDIPTMANFTTRLLVGEEMLSAKEEGHFPMGIRGETFVKPPKMGADRAVDMLLQKLNGDEYETEIPIPKIDKVSIAPPIDDLSKETVALVTSGGIVPQGNPDAIQSASATKWGKYDITGQDVLKPKEWETIHAGFDPHAANENPNVIVPLDAMRHFENEGKIGRLYHYLYATVGTGTSQAEASRMGSEIANELLDANVSAIVLTSTWGTCTRCGATITKEIERVGIPIVQMANIVSISETVGTNRIVPTISIPHPLGDPGRTEEEQWNLRKHRVEVALDSLTQNIEKPSIFEVKI